MRRHRGELQIFSLSMLDVIAGALGAFLILVILLLPYYKKEVADTVEHIRALEAELARTAAAAATARSEAQTLRMTDLDLVLAMDTTGSMRGEIDELKANLHSLVRLLRALTSSLRVGFVAYRDYTDAYVTRNFPLTAMDDAGYQGLHAFIGALAAEGGGDHEEAVQAALEQAVAQPWREAARGYIVLVGDAPAHEADAARAFALAAGEELIPAALVDGLLTGEPPLRVWREHRGLTQEALAAQVGITKSYLSQLEGGRRVGAATVLRRLATALGVDLEDLMGT